MKKVSKKLLARAERMATAGASIRTIGETLDIPLTGLYYYANRYGWPYNRPVGRTVAQRIRDDHDHRHWTLDELSRYHRQAPCRIQCILAGDQPSGR